MSVKAIVYFNLECGGDLGIVIVIFLLSGKKNSGVRWQEFLNSATKIPQAKHF